MFSARKLRWGGVTAVTGLIAGLLAFGAAAPAAATPSSGPVESARIVPLVAGQPGVPSTPTELYKENFENVQGRPLSAVIPLQNYVSAQGVTYTADPFWLNTAACNGFILNYQSSFVPGYCSNGGDQFNDALAKTYALGLLNSPQNPTTNWAVSSNTSANGPANQRMFVSSLLNVPANGRFITFSVDSAATACFAVQPKLRFSLVTSGGQLIPVSNGAINPCTNPNRQTAVVPTRDGLAQTVTYGSFAADSSILFNSNQLGISMVNEEGFGGGNDGAFDNIRVLDVTPQLDKSFSGGNRIDNGIPDVPVNGVSTLTFTVTNTSELAAKSGWSFTDSLPAGLVVAPTPNIGGTCDATTTVAAGATSISIANGNLVTGEVSCTVTVDVTSSTPLPDEASPKVYTNCAANITQVVGLNLPNCASVEFYTEPELELTKTSTATAETRAGDVVTYTITAENTGTQDYTVANPAVIFDDLSGVLDDATYNNDATSTVGGAPSYAAPLLSWSGALPAGDTVEITYSVTVSAPAGDGTIRNVAWVPNDPTDPQTPACAPPVDGVDPTTGEPCAVTSQPLPRLSINKSASQTELPAVGDQVTYTVRVTNEGPGDYTAANPGTATDDLSAVLDDATFDDATLTADIGTVTRNGDALSWTGALAAGEVATITYTVTYTGQGDNVLTNQACVPADETAPGFPSCDSVTIPGALLKQWKSAVASATPTVAGSTITYTLFFDNDGQAAADVDAVDDLTHVLDDADVTVEPTSADGLTVVRNGEQISITGSVPAGERYSVTYTVTVKADDERGDSIASNFLLAPGEEPPTDPECDPTDENFPNCTTTPITGVAYEKSVEASETPVVEGTELTYTITLRNTGSTVVDVLRDDNLTDVLDDADLTTDPESDTASVTVDGPTDGILAIRGDLAVGATATITYTVTVKAAEDRGNSSANNFLVPPGTTPPGTCDPATEQCTVTPILGYTVSKVADAETVQPGGVVTYTVTITNTGGVAFTDAAPATFTDDLTAVLDDAVYNGDVTAGGTVAGNTLSWAGPLGVGETVTVTYSVTVSDPATGDGTLTNAVVPTTPGGECDPDAECVVETPVAAYTVEKSVDVPSALPGDVVTYTVTVTNTGGAAYPADAPASFTDDLSAVLDDATYNDDASNGATVTGSTLTWSGPLAIDEVIEVTYSVTVNDPITGDQNLVNTVVPTGPGGTCAEDNECSTTTPVGSYTVNKTVDRTTALPGDVVSYEVTVTNTGEVAYTADQPATFTDDLSGVLDDAVYNDDATNGATVSGSTLSWSGALAVGETVTITYSVTVDAPVTGDFVLANVVAPTGPGGSCEETCETSTPIGSFRVVKSTDSTDVLPGETVEYSITVTNTGQVAYTADAPASFTDDLSAVLDDATYNGDATSSSGAGVDYTAPVLSWSGALDVGASVTITYSVTVNDPATGDQQLDNTVVTPPGTGGNCEPGSTDPACVANVPSGSYTVEKTADPASALPGDVVTYTVTVRNTGEVAYTAEEPASFSDDLSRVLDDAEYNGDVSPGGEITGTTLTWSGPLAVGEVLQVTYSVTVDDPVIGDFNLRNVVAPTSPGGECTDGGCIVDTPIAGYTVAKAADVTDVVLGGVVTYTVTVTNTGQVDYTDETPATFVDDLSGVLDDATYNGDASTGATVTGNTLDWSGALAIGESVDVTYSVTVNQPATGDGRLRNAVLPTGPGGGCTAEGECVTETPVATYKVAKTVSSERAAIGDKVTFTITVTNTGQVDYTDERPASFTDDLTSALKIGTYNGDATGGATYDAPVLSWSGALGVGEQATVTYSVTLRTAGEIHNVVITPDGSGANCAAGSADPDCDTTTVVTPPLAITGGQLWTAGGAAAVVMLLAGVWLIARRRRDAELPVTEA
ncbi:hypothetical protein ACI3KS_01760 [Microbacterium sp. ZW T5_45]|uniref:DUF7927 domain-containing protein n=1 Tax=Microbacterium sp. ZW T5_45 TaxID=3378080 RepID=UPI0038536611